MSGIWRRESREKEIGRKGWREEEREEKGK